MVSGFTLDLVIISLWNDCFLTVLPTKPMHPCCYWRKYLIQQ